MNLILDTVQQLNDYNDFDIYNVMESFDVPKLSTWQDQYDYLIETIDDFISLKYQEVTELKEFVQNNNINYNTDQIDKELSVLHLTIEKVKNEVDSKLKNSYSKNKFNGSLRSNKASHSVVKDTIVKCIFACRHYNTDYLNNFKIDIFNKCLNK